MVRSFSLSNCKSNIWLRQYPCCTHGMGSCSTSSTTNENRHRLFHCSWIHTHRWSMQDSQYQSSFSIMARRYVLDKIKSIRNLLGLSIFFIYFLYWWWHKCDNKHRVTNIKLVPVLKLACQNYLRIEIWKIWQIDYVHENFHFENSFWVISQILSFKNSQKSGIYFWI